MQTIYSSIKKQLPFLFIGLFALLLTSCGAYYSGTYEEDGIYASNETDSEVETSNGKASYYKQYFQSKDKSYEDLPEEDVIFTDIDAYSTTESLDEDGNIVVEEREMEYQDGYGGWGTNSSDVTLNIYNTGGFGWGGYWGWGYPFWNRGYWGASWGPGYYGGWGWGGSWGWGIGGLWCPPYYYGGFYGGFYGGYPYYRPYYGYGYGHSVAYNRGRRNTDYIAGRSVNRSRSKYSTGEISRRINRNARTNNSSTRVRGNNRTTRPNTVSRGRPTRPNNSYNTRPTRPNNSYRPSNTRPSRPSGNYSRPSTSRPSSGSIRGGSSRSRSGGVSRGGGGRRGGGRG